MKKKANKKRSYHGNNSFRKMHLQESSSKNLLNEAPVIRALQSQLWTPIIAKTMGINVDLLTGYSGDDEEPTDLIKMIKNRTEFPDETIKEKLTEHYTKMKNEIKNQPADSRITSILNYVNMRDHTGSSTLHYACQERFESATEICEFLLDRGAHIGVVAGRLGIAPLHLAIKSKNIPLALFLLDRGAPIDTKTLSFDSEDDVKNIMGRTGQIGEAGVTIGKTEGKATVYQVNCEGINILEEGDEISFKKADSIHRGMKKVKSRRTSGMLLHQESEENEREKIKYKISKIDYEAKLIDIDCKTIDSGSSAAIQLKDIMRDAKNTHQWMWVRKPIRKEDGNMSQFKRHNRWKGHFDESAIHMATRQCLIPVVKKLLELGANPNGKNYKGETPLHLCFRKNKEYKAVYLAARKKRYLINSTAEDRINWEHIKVKTYEEENPCSVIGSMLIESGGDIESLDVDSNPAMSPLDVEYWYESHKHELCSLLGNPTVKGYDNPIFSDKRTQFAINHQWQKRRAKYVVDILAWMLYMVLLIYPGFNVTRRHPYTKRWSDIKWATEELFVNEEFRKGMALNFNDIANVEEFYEWFDNVALPGLYGEALPYRNREGNTSRAGMLGAVSTFGRIVGRPRIRQLRSRLKQTCSGIYGVQEQNEGMCIYPYITKADDEFYIKLTKDDLKNPEYDRTSLDWKDMYCDGIGIIKGKKESPMDKDFYVTKFDSFHFHSGGFMPELPNPRLAGGLKKATLLSKKLKKCNFIDANTRVVIVEFALVNPSLLDIFTLAHFSVEFDVTGAVYPRSRIHQYRVFRDPRKLRHSIANDEPALYLHYLFVALTIYNLLVEVDQYATSVYNSEYMQFWPRFRFPGFRLAENEDENAKTIALSEFLREKLYRKDNNANSMSKRTPSFSIPISLRFAAAVAKTATENTPDKDSVQIYVRFPWKLKRAASNANVEQSAIDLFPADKYLTFMNRLSALIGDNKTLRDQGKVLQGRITLKIEVDFQENDIADDHSQIRTIFVADDDSINDLYLLLYSETKTIDKKYKMHEVYDFARVPNTLSIVFTFIVAEYEGGDGGLVYIQDGVEQQSIIPKDIWDKWDLVSELRMYIANRQDLKPECIELVLETGEKIDDDSDLREVGLKTDAGSKVIIFFEVIGTFIGLILFVCILFPFRVLLFLFNRTINSNNFTIGFVEYCRGIPYPFHYFCLRRRKSGIKNINANSQVSPEVSPVNNLNAINENSTSYVPISAPKKNPQYKNERIVVGFLPTSFVIPRYITNPLNLLDLLIYGIICVHLIMPGESYAKQNDIMKEAQQSILNGNDLDDVVLSKLFVLDGELFMEEFFLGLAFFLCFFRFLGYLKIFPHVMKTIHLIFLMMSKIMIYIVFLVVFVGAFAAMYWISIGTDLSGANGFVNILISQFAQSLGGQDYEAVDDMVTSEFKFLFILFLVLFSVFTVITVINLVIAVVTTAYEEGVEESSSYWAYIQLSNIHEDDFIEPDKNRVRKMSKFIFNGISTCLRSIGNVDNQVQTEFDRREKKQEERDIKILNSTTDNENEGAIDQDIYMKSSNKTKKKFLVQSNFEIASGNVDVEEYKDM